MKMKFQPCAYCGKIDTPRHKGHVISYQQYPHNTPANVNRPVVPECDNCAKLWNDAEPFFRNMLIIAGKENEAVLEKWHGPVLRSFYEVDGPDRVLELADRMVKLDQPVNGSEYMIFPNRDPQVMLILRRIVRGLCHYHNLGTAIADDRVQGRLVEASLPTELIGDFTHVNLGDAFCQYGYSDLRGKDPSFHSVWYVRFYNRTSFWAVITTEDCAKAYHAAGS
jgi:hypothetical protein